MKKKQSPVLIASMLFVLIGAVVVCGVMFRPMSEDEAKEVMQKMQEEASKNASGPRPTVPKEQLALDTVKEAMSTGQKGGPMSLPDAEEDQLAPMPTILKPTFKGFKPKPAEGDVHSQWYSPNDMVNAPKKPGK